MKVVGLASKVEEILKITQLYQVFPEFPTRPPHLRAFPRPPAAGIPRHLTSRPKTKKAIRGRVNGLPLQSLLEKVG